MQEVQAQHRDPHGFDCLWEEHPHQGAWPGGCDTAPFSAYQPQARHAGRHRVPRWRRQQSRRWSSPGRKQWVAARNLIGASREGGRRSAVLSKKQMRAGSNKIFQN